MQAVNAGKKVLADNAVTGQGLPTYGHERIDERHQRSRRHADP